jgi:GT2 family glycosyltransferase
MAKVSLIAVNHNTDVKLERLVETLHENAQNKIWELFIVDNGSTDASRPWLAQAVRNPRYDIKYVEKNANVGYAQACNAMASDPRVDGEILGFLNADAWLQSSDVSDLYEFFNQSDAAIVGPKQRDERGYITHAGMFGDSLENRGWQERDPSDRKYRDICAVASVSGSAYFIRREVFNALADCPAYRAFAPAAKGAFLPTFHFYEETFLSWHAREHDYQIYYNGEVSIGHSWRASTPDQDRTKLHTYSRESKRQYDEAIKTHTQLYKV